MLICVTNTYGTQTTKPQTGSIALPLTLYLGFEKPLVTVSHVVSTYSGVHLLAIQGIIKYLLTSKHSQG